MNTWTPLFNRIVDSSIWVESYQVRILFVTMLACKDPDHVVRFNAFNLAQKSKMSEKEVLEALKVLSSPDKRRIEPQEYDGRRIEKVEDGWLMLNGEYYKKLMQKSNRRVYQAEWEKEKRAKKRRYVPTKYGPIGDRTAERMARNGASDVELDTYQSHIEESRTDVKSLSKARS